MCSSGGVCPTTGFCAGLRLRTPLVLDCVAAKRRGDAAGRGGGNADAESDKAAGGHQDGAGWGVHPGAAAEGRKPSGPHAGV